MFIDNYQFYFNDYDKDEYSSRAWGESTKDLLLKTEVYKTFIDKCFEYITNKHINITHIIWDVNNNYSSYIDSLDEFKGFKMDLFNITVDDIIKLFDYIMDDSFILLYKDISYSPSIMPLIYII